MAMFRRAGRRSARRLPVGLLLLALLLSACGGGGKATSSGGSLTGAAAGVNLSDVKIGFGSKEFHPVAGAEPQYAAVRDADKANGITWFARAEANNTYAIAANAAAAKELKVSTLSDYARVAREQPAKAALCSTAEFVNRNDGLPGLEKAYGFSLPAAQTIPLENALIYTQVGKRAPCSFAVVGATDGQLLAQHLQVLKDDKGFFPLYNICVSMRTATYQAHAKEYEKLFGAIDAQLTDAKMSELNAKVDVDGDQPSAVAKQFLKDAGLVR